MRRVGLLPNRPGGRRRGSPVPTRPDALPAALAGYRVVSCDIFDTALARRLARPADLHLATATRARAHRLTACVPEAFREYRLEAERVLRQDLAAHGHDEVRIAEIYDRLAACGVVTDAGAAAAIEFAVERSVCVAIEPVRHALAGLDPDQLLVFTSDTTLPGAWLADLLIACGYGPDPRVICSADTRCNKASGRLFASLLAQLGCRPEQVVHLGDDAIADIARANEHGIRALYLPRPAVPPETDALAGRHFALRLAHSHRRSRLARPVQQGAPALHHYGSILLIGFTLFVLAEARRRGIRRIYFLARDGHIPLAIARRLIARSGEPFELSYLHVSRHSIVVPACSDDPDRLIEAISASMSTQTLDAIAAALGIEPDAIPGVLERSGVRPGQRLGGNTELLRRMIAVNQELIGHSLRRRRDLALGYLEQAGFLAPGKRLIVDTGWRGSTQQALVRLTGLPHSDLAGAYLGLWPEALGPGFDLSNAAGYLFAFGHPKPTLDMIRDGYVLLELFLSAPHAPTVHYAEQDGSVVPVYGREPEPGSTIRRRAIEALEQGCLAEFEALDAMFDGAWPDAIDPASALFDLEPLLTRPTRQEVAAINTVPYIHTADGSSNAVAVAPIPLLELIRAPTAAVRRIERAPWRSGTLRASLPWPVPGMSFAEFRYRFERLRRLLPGG